MVENYKNNEHKPNLTMNLKTSIGKYLILTFRLYLNSLNVYKCQIYFYFLFKYCALKLSLFFKINILSGAIKLNNYYLLNQEAP